MGEGGCQKINIFVLYNMWTTPKSTALAYRNNTAVLQAVSVPNKGLAWWRNGERRIIGRSLVQVLVGPPPGSDPGQVVHTHLLSEAWRLNCWHLWYHRITVLSQLFTHGAQVNSAFHPSAVDKWETAIRCDKGVRITSVGWQVILCDPIDK